MKVTLSRMSRGGLTRTRWLALAALGLAACEGPDALDRTEQGKLSAEDEVHPTDGSYMDVYEFEAGERYQIVVTLESDDFDPYLQVAGSGEQTWQNDDRAPGDTTAEIQATAGSHGQFRVWVNSRTPGEVGTYTLRIRTTPRS